MADDVGSGRVPIGWTSKRALVQIRELEDNWDGYSQTAIHALSAIAELSVTTSIAQIAAMQLQEAEDRYSLYVASWCRAGSGSARYTKSDSRSEEGGTHCDLAGFSSLDLGHLARYSGYFSVGVLLVCSRPILPRRLLRDRLAFLLDDLVEVTALSELGDGALSLDGPINEVDDRVGDR